MACLALAFVAGVRSASIEVSSSKEVFEYTTSKTPSFRPCSGSALAGLVACPPDNRTMLPVGVVHGCMEAVADAQADGAGGERRTPARQTDQQGPLGLQGRANRTQTKIPLLLGCDMTKAARRHLEDRLLGYGVMTNSRYVAVG